MLKRHFVGRGMHLEFCHPEYSNPIVTSRVEQIRECDNRTSLFDQSQLTGAKDVPGPIMWHDRYQQRPNP